MSDRYHSSAIVCIMLVVFWQYVWLNPTSNNDLFWYHQLHPVKMIPAVQWLLLSKSQSSYDILFFFFLSLSLSLLSFSPLILKPSFFFLFLPFPVRSFNLISCLVRQLLGDWALAHSFYFFLLSFSSFYFLFLPIRLGFPFPSLFFFFPNDWVIKPNITQSFFSSPFFFFPFFSLVGPISFSVD